MGNYHTTVTYTLERTVNEELESFDLEVVLTGYNGEDGGQSDREGATLFSVDGVEVDPYNDEEMDTEIRAALFDMEVNHYTNKNYKTREA